MMTPTELRLELDDSSAARVRLRLQYLGWTQAHLAEALGARGYYIRDLLCGQRNIDNWLERFAQAMGCSLVSLCPRGPWEPLVRGWIPHPSLRLE